MNRRQKIIVSITGIFIVLLALVGLTYAYFLTQITGNENDKSISVTTANLELTYGDGNGILLPAGVIEPSDKNIKFYVSNEETTDPTDVLTDNEGNPIVKENKIFTVTNNGEDSSYVVIIDEAETKYAGNGSYKDENGNTITYTKDQETEFVTNDFRYTLICVVKDNQGNILSDEKCNGSDTKSVFPIKGGILVGNAIEKEKVHEYTLTLWYIDNGQNQSIDMNKTYQARVNISDVNQMENPFKTGVTETDNASLAYNIIKNAKENKNGTKLLNTSSTKVAEERSYIKGTGKMVEQELDLSGKTWYYGSTYGDAQPWNSGSVEGSVSTCSDTIVNKYISYPEVGESWYVKSCKSETIAVVGVEEMEYESSIQTTQDDLGTSYYYRGAVEDNYVTFNNMCWRIVRIQGDGSIKLILESQSVCSENMTSNFSIGTDDWGYKKENGKSIGDYKNSTSGMKNLLNTWFNSNFKSNGNLTNAGLKIKDEEWCLGNTTNIYASSSPYGELGTTAEQNYASGTSFYYETGRNLLGKGVTPNATLVCNGETDSSKIGALTADEVVFAGGKAGMSNSNYYLRNGSYVWWTLSRAGFSGNFDYAFYVSNSGSLATSGVTVFDSAVRPSVTLVTNTQITKGEGTKGNPYIINEG